MAHEESEITPIEMLDKAVHAVPPIVAVARAAVNMLTQQLPGMERAEMIPLAQRAAALCGELTLADVEPDIAAEFGNYKGSYDALTQLFKRDTTAAEPAPTNTAAKADTGGMRDGKK
jgi:hypothetical protein